MPIANASYIYKNHVINVNQMVKYAMSRMCDPTETNLLQNNRKNFTTKFYFSSNNFPRIMNLLTPFQHFNNMVKSQQG